MAKDKEPFEGLTTSAQQTAKQITEQTQGAMENYFGWLQTTMSAFPWSNTNLNRILLSYATQNVTATFAFMQKLSQAKNFQDIVKIQTEFMQTQMNSFNEQAKILGEAKAAADAMKMRPNDSLLILASVAQELPLCHHAYDGKFSHGKRQRASRIFDRY